MTVSPSTPAVLLEAEVDPKAPDYAARMNAYAQQLEERLWRFGVEHFVVARKERDGKVLIQVLPCAPTPVHAKQDDAPPVETAGTTAQIRDALDRAVRRPVIAPQRQGPATAAGLAPAPGAGFGLRKRR